LAWRVFADSSPRVCRDKRTPSTPGAQKRRICFWSAILGGQLVGIRIEPATLMFYDPATRTLLRTRPNPLTRPKQPG